MENLPIVILVTSCLVLFISNNVFYRKIVSLRKDIMLYKEQIAKQGKYQSKKDDEYKNELRELEISVEESHDDEAEKEKELIDWLKKNAMFLDENRRWMKMGTFPRNKFIK